MTTKTYVGAIGTVITLNCGTDISAATEITIKVRKPDRTETTWTASPSGTNRMAFTTIAGTLDQPGTWRLQADVTLPAGHWPGETAELEVHKAFW